MGSKKPTFLDILRDKRRTQKQTFAIHRQMIKNSSNCEYIQYPLNVIKPFPNS
uniref:Candidate secreted effector n=1 Tax=Meloidogyne incognita TaxID=6306 RepID=A0A914KFM3_MELIC